MRILRCDFPCEESLACVQDAVRYAYFAPYTYEQHQSLIADCQSKPGVTLEMLGQTLDGHDMDLLRIGGVPMIIRELSALHEREAAVQLRWCAAVEFCNGNAHLVCR